MLERLICILIGYVFGLFQTSYIIGKIHKTDIREHGSGNAGTTNALRTFGKKAGAMTLLGDCLKCVFAIVAVRLIFKEKSADILPLLSIYAAAGCVLGHNFPFYLKFKGVKGIAASSGVVISLMLFPKYCFMFTVFGIFFFALVARISRYVSLASLIGMAMFFVEFLIWGFLGWLPLNGTDLVEGTVIVFALAALAFIRHRSNIVRLVQGTERKIGEKKN